MATLKRVIKIKRNCIQALQITESADGLIKVGFRPTNLRFR